MGGYVGGFLLLEVGVDKNLMTDRVTNPLMRYTSEFYKAEIRVRVEALRRVRHLRAEIKRQQKEYGPHERSTT